MKVNNFCFCIISFLFILSLTTLFAFWDGTLIYQIYLLYLLPAVVYCSIVPTVFKNKSDGVFLFITSVVVVLLSIVWWWIYTHWKMDLSGGHLVFGNRGDEFKYSQYILNGTSLNLGYAGVSDERYELFPQFLLFINGSDDSFIRIYLFNVFVYITTALLLFKLVKTIFSRDVALIACSLYALYPENYFWMATLYKDFLLVAATIIFVYSLVKLYRLLFPTVFLSIPIVVLRPFILLLIASSIFMGFVKRKSLILLCLLLVMIIVFIAYLNGFFSGYVELFFRPERLLVYWDKFYALSPFGVFGTILLIPAAFVFGIFFVFLQPFFYYPITTNVYDTLWRYLSLSGLYWFSFFPAYLMAFFNFNGSPTKGLSIFRYFLVFLALSLLVSFLFLTMRHRYLLTPFLLVLSAYGINRFSAFNTYKLSVYFIFVYFSVALGTIGFVMFRTGLNSQWG